MSIKCLAGLAGLAMRESQASAGIISSTGPVIAIFADELFLGVPSKLSEQYRRGI